MIVRYEAGYSATDIARDLGCDPRTIVYHLKRLGVSVRGPGMNTPISRAKWSGERHGQWKGGRFIDHGYVAVLRREHPLADADGYVKEHRLVMEEHLRSTDPRHPALLGGYLRAGWHVHHLNHDKLDNRIENLHILTKGEHSRLHNQLGQHDQTTEAYIAQLIARIASLEAQLRAARLDSTVTE